MNTTELYHLLEELRAYFETAARDARAQSVMFGTEAERARHDGQHRAYTDAESRLGELLADVAVVDVCEAVP